MKERIRELSGDGDAEAFDRYVLDNRRKLEFAKGGASKDPGNGVGDLFSKRALKARSRPSPAQERGW